MADDDEDATLHDGSPFDAAMLIPAWISALTLVNGGDDASRVAARAKNRYFASSEAAR
jgi:hypothetical protein